MRLASEQGVDLLVPDGRRGGARRGSRSAELCCRLVLDGGALRRCAVPAGAAPRGDRLSARSCPSAAGSTTGLRSSSARGSPGRAGRSAAAARQPTRSEEAGRPGREPSACDTPRSPPSSSPALHRAALARPAGEAGVLEAAEGAALVVLGLVRDVAPGGARARCGRRSQETLGAPVLLVRRGRDRGGSRPREGLTRYTWSLGQGSARRRSDRQVEHWSCKRSVVQPTNAARRPGLGATLAGSRDRRSPRSRRNERGLPGARNPACGNAVALKLLDPPNWRRTSSSGSVSHASRRSRHRSNIPTWISIYDAGEADWSSP